MSRTNTAYLLGRLGRDPEVRYTQGNKAVASFSIATTDRWEKDGEKQESTEWHNITCWGYLAEAAGAMLHKGQLVGVTGKLQTREWTDKQGNTRKTTEIRADNITRDLIDWYRSDKEEKYEEATSPASEPSREPVGDDNEEMPF